MGFSFVHTSRHTLVAVIVVPLLLLVRSSLAFTSRAPHFHPIVSSNHAPQRIYNNNQETTSLFAYYDEGSSSDSDTEDSEMDDEDEAIRDALKRELLLLSSFTNRGEYANKDEQDIIIDLVNQLEALNPTSEPASKCKGEWSLCLSSTQLFRSSPFFQTLRVVAGDDNKQLMDNGFDLHDRSTGGSRIGRVRQTITPDKLISEVELEVGILPGIPFRVKGSVVTTASLKVLSDETWELEIIGTQVKGSNIPLLNQLLDESNVVVPVGEVYKTLQGKVPIVKMSTYYVDEGIRITRDVDDNFFVFSRA